MTQTIINLGTGGAALNGQNGSTTSADSNDAKFLDWPGDNAGSYVYLPGVASNYLSVPDEAALDITGDIDIRVQVAMDDWTPSSTNVLISKYAASGTRSFIVQVLAAGTVQFVWSADGAANLSATSTAATALTDGSVKWVRVTLDVNNGASGNDVKFFMSDDGVTFTQLGSTVTAAGVTSVFSGSANVNVGSHTNGASNVATGKFYRAQILNGIDGTKVLDVDTSVLTSGAATTFTALTGQTVTINRSTAGRKSVAVVSPVWLLGTDDFINVTNSSLTQAPASQSLSVVAAVRQWGTPTSDGTYVAKGTGAGNRYYLASTNALVPQLNMSDGTTGANRTGPTTTAGQLSIIAGVIDRNANTAAVWNNGVSGATTSISAIAGVGINNLPLRIGSKSTGTTPQDFELIGAAVFRKALVQSEIAAITSYYQARLS
jgi:hypothetical protein